MEITLKVTQAWSLRSRSRVLTSISPKALLQIVVNAFNLRHPRWELQWKIYSLPRHFSNGLITFPLWSHETRTRTLKACHTYIMGPGIIDQLIKRRCKLIYTILSSIFSNRDGRIVSCTKKFILISCRELNRKKNLRRSWQWVKDKWIRKIKARETPLRMDCRSLFWTVRAW